MGLSTTTARVSYAGDGSTTAFSFPYKYLSHDDFLVQLELISSGAKTTQTLDTDYTVTTTGVATNGVYPGATITFSTAPSALYNVIIARKPVLTQEFDFDAESDPLPVITRHADYVEMKLQSLAAEIADLEANESTITALVMEVETYANLRALTAGILNAVAVRGRTTAGDGGGGIFRWSSANNSANVTLDPNAGIYVPPSSDTSGASGCWVRDVDGVRYEVEWFGAVGDGVTDDATAIQAAITYLSSLASRGGTVGVGLKQYYLGSGLTIDSEGITLEGGGTADMWFPSGWGRSPTELMFGHTNGDAIRCKKSSINIRDLRVNANATRQAASAGSNYGIRFEATDDADASRRVNFCHMHNVHVINQPNHNVCVIGNSVGTLFEQVVAEASIGGHGIVIDCGDQTGRTNKARPGLAVLDNCRANDNKGHGLCIGHPSNSTNLPYRGIISNFESYRNALTSGARHTAHDGYVFGENIELIACAFSGQDASLTDNVNSGLNLAGRNVSIRNGRFVSTNVPITVAALSGITTRGVIIENPTIAGGTTRAVAVVFESGIGDVRAIIGYTSGFTDFTTTESNITNGKLFKHIGSAMAFGGSSVLGAPTGGDKGAGTNNAERLYEMGRGIWSILAASFVSVNTPADTSEDTLATIAVPANALGANGLLRVTALWSYTNSANNKTMRVRFGGTSMFSNVVTTTASQQMQAIIANVNATNVQKCFGGGTSFTASTNSISAGAIDTTSSANITITGTKASSGETLTLEGYVVEIFKQA